MTQVAGMKSAPSSRLPIPLPRGKPGGVNYDINKTTSAPTKLELMQMQYQDKLKHNKEQRMMEINMQNEERTMRFGDGPSRSVVKDFFKERREMGTNGYTPDIAQHFHQKKSETTGQGSTYSNQYQYKKQLGYASKPPLHKNSAGRDKSNPLAPIEKPSRGGDVGKRSRKSSAASNGSYYSQKNGPFARKAQPISRKSSFTSGANTPVAQDHEFVSNSHRSKHTGELSEDEEKNAFSSRNGSPNKKTSFKDWQDKQKKIREKQHTNTEHNMNSIQEHTSSNDAKLTDFQKWQLEQDQERAQRLQKHNQINGHSQNPPLSNRSNASRVGSQISIADGIKSPGRAKKHFLQKHINTQSKKHLYASNTSSKQVSEYDSDDGDDTPNQSQEMLQKQRELEALLRQQQEELQKMKKKRETEEDQERKARDREAKRAAQQKERQRKLKEAEERKKREQEEKENKEQEKREMDERDMRWVEEQKQAMSRQTNQVSDRSHNDHYNEYSAPISRAESEAERQPPIPKKPARVKMNKSKPLPEKPQSPEPYSNFQNEHAADFYNQAAVEDPEAHGKVDLANCHSCGRKFARDRLEKHFKVCKSSQTKKRKVFDPVKMRVSGTEMAPFVAENDHRPKREPPKKKNNWRNQHDNFIKTIRYAKQVTEAEKTGNVAHLPPPPRSENLDYVPCPYCNRKFNAAAAERHIPRCKDVKSRPPPMKR